MAYRIVALQEIFDAGDGYWNSLAQELNQVVDSGRFDEQKFGADGVVAKSDAVDLTQVREEVPRYPDRLIRWPAGSSGVVSIFSLLSYTSSACSRVEKKILMVRTP